MEAHLRAAPVAHLSERLDLALRDAAREHLAVELLAAGHLDLQPVGEGVHDGDADAVQAAGGLVNLAVELSAGVQRGHDDLERRLVLELGVGVDGDAAAVVGDGQRAIGLELDGNEGGVAGHRLVHGIVDHLGEEVVQRLLVRAADIHARAAAHRLQALQHLDGSRGVSRLAGRAGRRRGRRRRGRLATGRRGRRSLLRQLARRRAVAEEITRIRHGALVPALNRGSRDHAMARSMT